MFEKLKVVDKFTYLVHIDDEVTARILVLYGEENEGKRSQDGQEKRYRDILKASLKDFDIPMGSWEQTTQERLKWRGLINKGAALYKKERESVKLK